MLALGGFAAGCNKGEKLDESPAEAAKQAEGVNNNEGTRDTVTDRKNVVVDESTKVIDPDTGKVTTTEEKQTPVTIDKKEKVDTDTDVNVGDTEKKVE
jgi:hypothetical protein